MFRYPNRTVEKALEHAKGQEKYPMRDAEPLVTDFVLLAEEVIRLRKQVSELESDVQHYAELANGEST